MKPIETVYKGYRFRSRLEARWAVFLDQADIPWEYEKQGYRLTDGSWYLPDFWIPLPPPYAPGAVSAGYWLEIKGQPPTNEEKTRCGLLARETSHVVYLVSGPPGDEKTIWKWYCDGRLLWDGVTGEGGIPEPELHFWCTAARAGSRPENLDDGIRAARSARFEHGESPG